MELLVLGAYFTFVIAFMILADMRQKKRKKKRTAPSGRVRHKASFKPNTHGSKCGKKDPLHKQKPTPANPAGEQERA